MARIEQHTLQTLLDDKHLEYSVAFSACACPACCGKTGSEIATGVSDTIPNVPSGVIVPVNGTLDGWISPVNDTDLLTINVVAGATYLVGMDGAGEQPLEDSFLVLYDAGGVLVNFDDDGGTGTNSLLTFTADYTGVYYASAEAFAGTGQYTVTVEQQSADNVPDTFAGAVALGSNESTFNFLETSLDIDTYRVDLTAGLVYTFEVAGGADYNTDFLAVPTGELDTLLALYDANGALVTFNDDISFPSDISSRLTIFAETSATYYLDVFAYPGQTGGYHLVSDAVDPSTLNPLDSIDWKTSNPVDSNVTVYFAQTGEVLDGVTSLGWSDYEIAQTMLALEQYENIINVTTSITDDPTNATFRLVTTTSNQFGAYMYPNDPQFGDNVGIGVFAINNFGWDDFEGGGLEQGGYSFETILHEFGHAFGLAHPHDTGGGSDIMPGVTGPDSLGIYDLNQGIYTVMTYNPGWQTHPDIAPNGFPPGVSAEWGFDGTMMTFDTALLQQKYGANTSYASGNDTYVLPDDNELGTFYQTIWDTGGTDTIEYRGASDARIDLLAATIDYTPTGGGVVSFVDNTFGGYIIANGVVIENATGGRGDDVLLGNSAANALVGGNGDDTIEGRAGADTITGGVGDDLARGGDGDDTITGDSGSDELYGDAGNDTIRGGSLADELFGGTGDDRLYGDSGNDLLVGGAGDDLLVGGSGNDIFFFDDLFGFDTISDFNVRNDKIDWSQVEASYDTSAMAGGSTLFDFSDGSSLLLSGVAIGQLSGAGWYQSTAMTSQSVFI